MTKSTITREQLLEIIETDHVQCGEASYLARMALAAMDSDPVAWRQPFTGCCVSSIFYQDGSSPLDHGYEPLYAAPPEPVVPVVPVNILRSVYQVIYQECGGFVDCDANAKQSGTPAAQPCSQPPRRR
ncbi:hypothetical protein [Klebsiella pneumoniae]|uniref:hypothetical protein n=1 Tax=Klebsiella pneumoniae TaxID=573 RepID=UPI0020CD5F9C|nr:hypothetical protein [Klebsiella pneumoniae]MCQ0659581.1 hypothetical protein [Klebsiella pneumoniae]